MSADGVLKAIARRLAQEEWPSQPEYHQADAELFERTLRDMGVGEAFEQFEKLIERFKRGLIITEAVPDEESAENAVSVERAALDKVLKAGG